MPNYPPVGIYYRDEDTPCWAFRTRNAFKLAFGLKEKAMVDGLSTSDGYRFHDELCGRYMDKAAFVERMEPRLGTALDAAVARMRENRSPRDLLGPEPAREATDITQSCTKCHVEKPVTSGHFYWNKAKNRFHVSCIECHNNLMNKKNAEASAAKRAAASFTCIMCDAATDRKELAKGETNMCKTCKRTLVEASSLDVKKWIGLFPRSDSNDSDAMPIWKWESAHSFYETAMGFRHREFNQQMVDNGFWAKDDAAPYVIRYITKETFDSTHVDVEMGEQVIEAIKAGNLISGTLRDHCSTKRCRQCHVIKEEPGGFPREKDRYRSTCQQCRSTANAENARMQFEADSEQGWFHCTECNVPHDASERMRGQSACRASINAKKLASVAERAKEIDRDEVPGRDCLKCGKKFQPEDFKWKQVCWSSDCRECYNEKKYWLTWREKKRNEDLEDYLRYYARQQLAWRRNNPLSLEAYNTTRRTDPALRLKRIQASAASRNVDYREEDTAAMLKILQQPCQYCETSPDPADRLNGLDRVDNALGYREDNVVASCPLDNILKGTSSAEEYIRRMCLIYTVSQKNGVVINDNVVPHINFSGATKPSTWGRKAGVNTIKSTEEICYLCEEFGRCTTDRVDSGQSYVDVTNRKPCCWPCNKLKNELSLDALYLHASRIYSRNDCEKAVVPAKLLETVETPTLTMPSESRTTNMRHHPHRFGYFVYDTNNVRVASFLGRKYLAEALHTPESSLKLLQDQSGNGDRFEIDEWRCERVPTATFVEITDKEPVVFSKSFERYLASRPHRLMRRHPVFNGALETALIPTRQEPAEPCEPVTANESTQLRHRAQHYGYHVYDKYTNQVVAIFHGIKELSTALGLSSSGLLKRFDKFKGTRYELMGRWIIEKLVGSVYGRFDVTVHRSTEFEQLIDDNSQIKLTSIHLCTENPGPRTLKRRYAADDTAWVLVYDENSENVLAKYESVPALASVLSRDPKSIGDALRLGKLLSRWPIKNVDSSEASRTHCIAQDEFPAMYADNPSAILLYDGETLVAKAENSARLTQLLGKGNDRSYVSRRLKAGTVKTPLGVTLRLVKSSVQQYNDAAISPDLTSQYFPL